MPMFQTKWIGPQPCWTGLPGTLQTSSPDESLLKFALSSWLACMACYMEKLYHVLRLYSNTLVPNTKFRGVWKVVTKPNSTHYITWPRQKTSCDGIVMKTYADCFHWFFRSTSTTSIQSEHPTLPKLETRAPRVARDSWANIAEQTAEPRGLQSQA